tara:strand:+ start:18085 stop:18237 length:153 start_codon:yes stop_codon:yes gene_type:complete
MGCTAADDARGGAADLAGDILGANVDNGRQRAGEGVWRLAGGRNEPTMSV